MTSLNKFFGQLTGNTLLIKLDTLNNNLKLLTITLTAITQEREVLQTRLHKESLKPKYRTSKRECHGQ